MATVAESFAVETSGIGPPESVAFRMEVKLRSTAANRPAQHNSFIKAIRRKSGKLVIRRK